MKANNLNINKDFLRPENYLLSLKDVLTKTKVNDGNGSVIDYNDCIYNLIHLFKERVSMGNKIMFIGNGGSAGIASHMAIDFAKNGKMRSLCFNEGAHLTCLSNDYGYEKVFEKSLEIYGDKEDILVAISSSGQSENILHGVEAAKLIGCTVVTLSGFLEKNPLRKMGDYNLYVPSSEYGFVELAHQIILHNVVDLSMEI